jgi:hypothetical protein
VELPKIEHMTLKKLLKKREEDWKKMEKLYEVVKALKKKMLEL